MEKSSADELAHDLGGVVDHRDHAGVIEPGRTDHPDDSDDAPGTVAIGGHNGGRARKREQLVLRPYEYARTLRVLGPAEQIDHAAFGLEVIEKQPHALEIFDRLEVIEQMRRTSNNQLTLVGLAAGPA